MADGSTKSFVWSTDDHLGSGATAEVYLGRNRTKGTKVAVKVFNRQAKMRPLEVQHREFEILKKLNHENIVGLIAIESQHRGCGICVKNNIVHRDVKPGNILRAIGDDGRSIYKLTDFGGAKELPEGENFMSLVGTEEYLHPAIFERAIMRRSAPHLVDFPAEVDLWSMGVTLYHAATGSLPFRPFGGRRDPHSMHHITSKKESGVISGVMKSAAGPILWSKKLPDTCNLSRYLKKELPPVIAGLVECDIRKMSTFDMFFQQVDNITLRIPVHVLSIRDMELLTLYVTSGNRVNDLQILISEYAGVRPEKQYLFFEEVRLEDLIDSKTPARDWPRTSQQTPFIMVTEKANKMDKLAKPAYLKAPSAPVGSYSKGLVYQQLDYAIDIFSVVQEAGNIISQHEQAIQHMATTIKILCSYVTHQLKDLANLKDVVERVEGDMQNLKDNAIDLLKKLKEPGQDERVKNIETLTDKVLERCMSFKKLAFELQGCSVKQWTSQTLLASLEKQRLVAKMKRRLEETEDIYIDTRNQLHTKDYVTNAKMTSNQYARIRLGSIAEEAISALDQFLANEASQSLKEANTALDSIVPQMVKLKEFNPQATCASLMKEHIRLSGEVRELQGAILKNPSLSTTAKPLTCTTGNGVSSQQKSEVSGECGSKQSGSEDQMLVIASQLKKLGAKNEELLGPMKQNMEMVLKINDIVEKYFSVPLATDEDWTFNN